MHTSEVVRAESFDAVWLEIGDRDADRLVETVAATGMSVERFGRNRMVRGQCKIDTRALVVGGLEASRAALRLLGRDIPAPLDNPPPLEGFLHRRVWQSTLSAARAGIERDGQPIFVKPRSTHKRFTGLVVNSADDWTLSSVPGRTEAWCSDVVTFQSEHRAFVCEQEILGVRHYWGDPTARPNAATLRAMANAYETTAPAAYALDVGVLSSGATALIEVTDGFALDSYGLDPDLYLAVCAKRWRQLVGPVPGVA